MAFQLNFTTTHLVTHFSRYESRLTLNKWPNSCLSKCLLNDSISYQFSSVKASEKIHNKADYLKAKLTNLAFTWQSNVCNFICVKQLFCPIFFFFLLQGSTVVMWAHVWCLSLPWSDWWALGKPRLLFLPFTQWLDSEVSAHVSPRRRGSDGNAKARWEMKCKSCSKSAGACSLELQVPW